MFAKVEIVPFGQREKKVGNTAHENWLKWSWGKFHLTAFRVKLSHDKTFIEFTCPKALEEFENTWKHYYRRIY